MRVPWTARRSNQSILKEISPRCSLEGLMLKLKLQYFGHFMRRVDSLEKTLMLGGSGGRRRRGRQCIEEPVSRSAKPFRSGFIRKMLFVSGSYLNKNGKQQKNTLVYYKRYLDSEPFHHRAVHLPCSGDHHDSPDARSACGKRIENHPNGHN